MDHNLGDPYEISAINRQGGYMLTETNDIIPVDVWLDKDGNKTNESSEAMIAIGNLPGGGVITVYLGDYETVLSH